MGREEESVWEVEASKRESFVDWAMAWARESWGSAE